MLALLLFFFFIGVRMEEDGGACARWHWWCCCCCCSSLLSSGIRCVVVDSLTILCFCGVVAGFSYLQEAQLHLTVTSGTFSKGAAFLLLLCLHCLRLCCYCHHCSFDSNCFPFISGVAAPQELSLARGIVLLCIFSPQDFSSSVGAVLVMGMLPAVFIRRLFICGRGFIGAPGRITSTMFWWWLLVFFPSSSWATWL